MKLTVTLLMICLSLSTYGRAPAVDPFVGVEPSGYVDRAPSSEQPFNFEQEQKPLEIKTTSKAPSAAPVVTQASANKDGFTLPYFFILAGIITLPFAVWQMLMNRLENKTTSSNVVSFPGKKGDKDDDDDWKKKAS